MTPTILLIDDDDAVRDSLSIALEDEGYRVQNARNAAEALSHLAENEAPSCILLDLMMPSMSGYELRRHLLEDQKLSAVPTFVLTAGAIDDRIRQLSVHGWFRKPFSVDHLLSALDRQLRPEKRAPDSGEGDGARVEKAGAYLAEGASRGDGILVVAPLGVRRKLHEAMSRAGVEPSALDLSTAVWIDAERTLSRFMEGARPDPVRFHRVITQVVRSVSEASRSGRTRGYNGMVDLLRRDGNLGGALELEQMWNRLLNPPS